MASGELPWIRPLGPRHGRCASSGFDFFGIPVLRIALRHPQGMPHYIQNAACYRGFRDPDP